MESPSSVDTYKEGASTRLLLSTSCQNLIYVKLSHREMRLSQRLVIMAFTFEKTFTEIEILHNKFRDSYA